ncbi:penicillin-binding protein 2B (PBP-2B) [Planococcus donghaensis MPA1U2]|uniref:Penicillin-binding protein 2B (PBP-2B) n=1 Tax=Planococcus donghaensis MPA1U2 TaxID=933115 RepID=E7RHK1_9BACL|nr:penicillin-binding protein [Planococcus donghaensis]EGA89445.1 penicillin-binding protein 2B (PBP-2B) [Planococcus donghaensis MPA1U2]
MKKKFRFQGGAFLLFLLFAGLFFLLLARIVTIQATGKVEGQELAAKAAAKYSQEEVLTAERGRIIDRNGEIIAEDTLTYKLVAVLDESVTQKASDPQHVVDIEETAKKLAGYLDTSEEKILEILKNGVEKDRYQVEFGSAGREISHTQMLAMKEEDIPGLLFVRDLKRLYPNGVFASHLIGYAMKEELENGETKTTGRMGLESIHNDVLTGKNGKMEFDTDKWGFLLPNNESAITPAVNGADVQLTLDKTLQNFLEDAMTGVQEEYDPTRMIAVIADPKTGEILAMSQRPTFDPNTREGLSDNWLNESIELTIEPGSPMKMFTLAAAIEEGKWDPNATYKSGTYTLLDSKIGDHNSGRGWGTISFLEGFQRSSNVSMAYLLERLGADTFMNYVDAFGFGEQTGIDLPKEASGKILNQWPINKLTTAYGQGSTVTPIQMIQAASAIANDGVMMKPYVIDQIKNSDTGKVTVKSEPQEAGQPISAETANQVKEVLASTVTSDVGSARGFALKDYTVAGKTGTAQVPKEGGGYLTGRNNYLFSFLGMAPADDPELLIYIGVQQPNVPANEYGSVPVAKIFTSVMENSLKYLNIEPENMAEAATVPVEEYTGKTVTQATEALQELGIEVEVIGNTEEIISQYPEVGNAVLKGGRVVLQTAGDTTLPDFTGWSKRELLAYQALSGLALEIAGQGYAMTQSVEAGQLVVGSDPVIIELYPPEIFYPAQAKEQEENLEEDQIPPEQEVIEDTGSETIVEEAENEVPIEPETQPNTEAQANIESQTDESTE